jgi:hypothetical protein
VGGSAPIGAALNTVSTLSNATRRRNTEDEQLGKECGNSIVDGVCSRGVGGRRWC